MDTKQNKAAPVSEEQKQQLLITLRDRFGKNMGRHKTLKWEPIGAKLAALPLSYGKKLWSLNVMEKTGGEPDVIGVDQKTGEYIFCDCSTESPAGRRSLCYDRGALEARKENKPKDSAIAMCETMGIELLGEDDYRRLQELGKFDTKTSSWLLTPYPIRKLGGAIFADRRYDHIFIYHNGADSYYASRAFRGSLRI